MTVSAKSSRKVITGSGWSNPLSFDIYIESSSHIQVWADDELLALGSDYTVSGVANPAGFSVTILSPSSYATVEKWVLLHTPPMTQGADLSVGGAFGLAFENAADAITRRLQATDEKANRALKLPLTSAGNENFVDRVPIGDANGYFGPGPDAGQIASAEAHAAAAALAKIQAEAAKEEALAAALAAALSASAAANILATYDNMQAFLDATIPAPVQTVKLLGYYTAGDTESPIVLRVNNGLGPGTNLVRVSNRFDDALWTKSLCEPVVLQKQRMLHGTDEYFTYLVPDTSTGNHQLLQSVSFVSGRTYTIGWKVAWKAGDYSYARLSLPTSAFGSGKYAQFNLSNGNVQSIAGISASDRGSIDLGDGEYFIWIKAVATATVAGNIGIMVVNNSISANFAGNGTSGIRVAECQVDEADGPTEYVKTYYYAVDRRIEKGYVSHPASGEWKYDIEQQLTSKKMSAKADTIDTGAAFVGTDDTEAVADLIGFASLHRRKAWFSAGDHNIVIPNQTGVDGYAVYIGYNEVNLCGFGQGISRICVNEDTDYYLNFAHSGRCFGSGLSRPGYARDVWKRFSQSGFTYQGRWSHVPGRYGTFAVWVEGYETVEQHNMEYLDMRQGPFQTKYGKNYKNTFSHAERIGVGALARPIDFDNVIIAGISARYSDDDIIDCSTGVSAAGGSVRPVRQGAQISGCVFVETESVLCYGYRNATLSDIVMIRPKGAPVVIGYTDAQGSIAASDNVSVSNIVIVDAFGRYDYDPDYILYDAQTANFTVGQVVTGANSGAYGTIRDITDDGTTGRLYLVDINGTFVDNDPLSDPLGGAALANGTLVSGAGWRWFATESGGITFAGSGASTVGTTNGVVPGRWDPTAGVYLQEWTNQGTIPKWGAMNAGPYSATASPGAVNLTVTNCIVARTLPSGVKYSELGYGLYFNGFDGFLDPDVTEEAFREAGYTFWAGLQNARLSGLISWHMKTAGLDFAITGQWTIGRRRAFKNIFFTDCMFIGCKNGFNKDNDSAGGTPGVDWDAWSLVFRNCLFDLDPRAEAPIRNSDGSWDNDSSNDYRALNLMRLEGVIVEGCIFRNCWAPFAYAASGPGVYHAHGKFFNNVVQCEPYATGYSTTNLGVAYIHRADGMLNYMPVYSTPGASYEGSPIPNSCLQAATTRPTDTNAIYVEGHFVRNVAARSVASDKSLEGWIAASTKKLENIAYPTANYDFLPVYAYHA